MRRAGALVITLSMLSTTSCFFDSQWGQAKKAQQAAAQRATPGELKASRETDLRPVRGARALRMRAYATPRYAAEVVDWRRQLVELIDDANRILGPALDARIELAGAETWLPRVGDDDLDALGQDLASVDPARDVEWVVGFVGSVPRLEQSFHQLGLGQILGKHLLLRAMSDAHEYESIQQNLSELDEKKRLGLYRARKRHKATTVLLHEVGHTLGVPHELDPRTVMSPRYDPKTEGFSDAAVQLMRISLAHRLEPAAKTLHEFAAALVDHLRKTSEIWVPAERDRMIAFLTPRAPAARPSQSPAAPPPSSPATPAEDPLAALRPADRAAFEQALVDLRDGNGREAWKRAKPVFGAYPNVFAVQDFRCRLAMRLGLTMDEMNAQCARVLELTRQGKAR